MAQIIFVVEKPDFDTLNNEQLWNGCTSSLSHLTKQNKDIQLLGENVLLISLDKDLSGLVKVVHATNGLRYKYQVLNEDLVFRKVTTQG